MAEQPLYHIGKNAIRRQPDNGLFAPAYLAIENQSDGDLDQPQSAKNTSESVDSRAEQHPILEPEEDIQDLSLPSKVDTDVFYKFFKLLEAFDYQPHDVVKAASLRLYYKYTQVIGVSDDKSQYRALIYIREEILNNPYVKEPDLATINMITSAFDKDATIIIFSKSSEYPNIDIYWLLKEEWPKRIKKGEFVPWKYVEYLTRKYDQINQIQNQKSPKYDAMMTVLKKEVAKILDGLVGKIQSDS